MHIHKMRKYADVQDIEDVNESGDQSGHSQSLANVNAKSEKYSEPGSSSHRQESNKYDIFINHRGPDTKNSFVTFLEDDLKQKHYSPFVDKSLEEGEHAFEEIKKAIHNTRIHLAIFSPHYAESEYCLKELVDMLEVRRETKDDSNPVTLIPIFFNVKPKDLQNTLYGTPFYEAFRWHEKKGKYSDELISIWKEALRDASLLKGFIHNPDLDANELKNKVVARIQKIISPRIGSGNNVVILDRSQSHPHPKRGGNEDLARKVKSDILDPRAINDQQGPPESHQLEEVVDPHLSEIASADHLPEPQPPSNENQGVSPENDEAVTTFGSEDRPLRILVLGKSDSVEQVVRHICGAGRRKTQVQDYVSLTESRSSSPPMCLYYSFKQGSGRSDFTDSIFRTFVKDRNYRFHRKHVVTLCLDEVYHRRPPGERPVLLLDGALRLHMVWLVCRNMQDLPNKLDWIEITKNLYDLPIQILVAPDSENLGGYDRIFGQRNRLFPNAQENAQNLHELIVRFDLNDENMKENLWRMCWEVKTRAEIVNVARIISDIRKEIGSTGIAVPKGYGAEIPREVSLVLSGRFVLNFLCKYWGVSDSNSIADVILETTTFVQLAPGNKDRYSIKAHEFVKFCLQVAVIILINARDEDRNLKYVCNWPDRSSESFQLLKTETEECYERYFPREGTDLSYYDKMKFEHIRVFLQNIFERKNNFEGLEGMEGSSPGQDRTGSSCWSCLIL